MSYVINLAVINNVPCTIRHYKHIDIISNVDKDVLLKLIKSEHRGKKIIRLYSHIIFIVVNFIFRQKI